MRLATALALGSCLAWALHWLARLTPALIVAYIAYHIIVTSR